MGVRPGRSAQMAKQVLLVCLVVLAVFLSCSTGIAAAAGGAEAIVRVAA